MMTIVDWMIWFTFVSLILFFIVVAGPISLFLMRYFDERRERKNSYKVMNKGWIDLTKQGEKK